jgi:cobalt-zinc-cadmium efflux system outer membrane protein
MRDKVRSRFAIVLLFSAGMAWTARGQEPAQRETAAPAHPEHHPSQAPAGPALPAASSAPGDSALSLRDLEARALEKNPTLAQATAGVREARGLARQAGSYPNPVIGVLGDDNTSNVTFRGGEIGMFGEQRIVTAGKLRLSRGVYSQQEMQAQAAEEAQRYRVLTAVRALFYEALGAERLVEVQRRLAELANEAVTISRELANVGQADQPDVLQSEIEAQQAEVALVRAEIEQQRVWRQLAAVAGDPALEITPLEGDIEAIPALEQDSALQKILQESPEVKIAAAGVARASAALEREKVETIPDILVRGGFKYHPFLGADRRPVGIVGFFDVGIAIPLFDRNKGAIDAARGQVESAERDADRVRLSLHSRLAEVYQDYEASARLAGKYRQEMLPRAQRAYELYRNSFQQMAAAYPQVIIAQRNLFQLQRDYVHELVSVWKSAVEMEGMLLSGGLERPFEARMEPPMNMDEH